MKNPEQETVACIVQMLMQFASSNPVPLPTDPKKFMETLTLYESLVKRIYLMIESESIENFKTRQWYVDGSIHY